MSKSKSDIMVADGTKGRFNVHAGLVMLAIAGLLILLSYVTLSELASRTADWRSWCADPCGTVTSRGYEPPSFGIAERYYLTVQSSVEFYDDDGNYSWATTKVYVPSDEWYETSIGDWYGDTHEVTLTYEPNGIFAGLPSFMCNVIAWETLIIAVCFGMAALSVICDSISSQKPAY